MPRGVEATLGEHTVRSASTGTAPQPDRGGTPRRRAASFRAGSSWSRFPASCSSAGSSPGRQARHLRVPDLGHHRDAAQPAGLDADVAALPARARGGRRLPLARGRDRRRRRPRRRRGGQPGASARATRSRRSSRSSPGRGSPRPSAASTASRTGSTPAGSAACTSRTSATASSRTSRSRAWATTPSARSTSASRSRARSCRA